MRSLRTCLTVLTGLIALLVTSSALAEKPKRGVVVTPQVPAGSVPMSGEYWALIIGIDQYLHAPKLQSAVKDAKGVRDVLVERYGFKKDRITELFNDQATGPKIQNALYQLGRQAGKDDSVFIYYAGHGQYDEDGRLGWWVPVEAQPKDPGTFIMDTSVLSFVKGMKAKHVYLVADSCFSGTLFGTRALPPLNDQFFARLYAHPSRWGLTSGGTEPVADQGKNGHSIFAYHFINLLKENSDPYLVPSHIYDQLAPLIANNADQTPRSEPLKGAGDEGGQFVFRLAYVSSGPLPNPPSQAGAGAPSEDVAALKKRLEELEGKLARPPDPPKPIEEVRARPYDAPQQMAKEITGKDGAPMVLVSAGEFMMGSNDFADEQPVHRVYLDDYFIDQYEVTTRLYAAFLQATGRVTPWKWDQVSQGSDGDRPVVGVNWHDADAYCRYYGKRLPTEAEWEKAARGTDGRNYPWGNKEPSGRYANFGKSEWQGYETLKIAGEYEAGKSPYGLYDMAGNVGEWVTDWYDKDYYQRSPNRNPTGPSGGTEKVLRGGSWQNVANTVRSANRSYRTPAAGLDNGGFRCANTP